jgi:hypothetical protein
MEMEIPDPLRPYIFIGAGIIFIFIPIRILIRRKRVLENGEQTDAVVIRNELDESRGTNGIRTYSYAPVFKFTVDELEYEVKYYVSRPKIKYKDGETVKIVYDKGNVTDVHLACDNFPYIFSAIFILMGILFICIGLFMFLYPMG